MIIRAVLCDVMAAYEALTSLEVRRLVRLSVPSLRVPQDMGVADGGTFACRAVNAHGTATSRSATVSVAPRYDAIRH